MSVAYASGSEKVAKAQLDALKLKLDLVMSADQRSHDQELSMFLAETLMVLGALVAACFSCSMMRRRRKGKRGDQGWSKV